MTLNSAKLHFMYDQLFFLFVFNVYTTFEKYNKYKVKTKQTNKQRRPYLFAEQNLFTDMVYCGYKYLFLDCSREPSDYKSLLASFPCSNFLQLGSAFLTNISLLYGLFKIV